MKARIVNNEFGGVHSDKWLNDNTNLIIGGQLVSEWQLTETLPSSEIKLPQWTGTEWIESYVEIIVVPKEISRMKFKKQIRRSTIYTYEIVLAYLQNLTITETFTEEMKLDIIDDFEDCTHFERYNPDFINLANMLGVSDEIKDEIFINGNLI